MEKDLEKACSMCKESKTLDNFQKDKKGKLGVRARCKVCCSIIKKQNYQKNKDKVAEYNKKRYAENKDAIREGQKRYYQENKEVIKENVRKWEQDNHERVAERQARYRKEKPDLHRARQKRYVENNPERVRELGVKHSQTRRARVRELVHDLTEQEWHETIKYFDNSCAYCGERNCKLEQEHIVPVTSGGGYTKSNIVPSCKTCNSSKHDTELVAWYKNQDAYSEKRLLKVIEFSETYRQSRNSNKMIYK